MTEFDLIGLQPHHPLGFLAACGLLRGLAACHGVNQVKLGWRYGEDGNTHAFIASSLHLDMETITKTLNCRAEQQRESAALTWSKKIDNRGKYREAVQAIIGQGGERDSLDMFVAQASDLVTAQKTGKLVSLVSTDFVMTSGKQSFLKSLCDMAKNFEEEAIKETLCGPWAYQDDAHSLGWDPQVQRLHALRGMAPEKNRKNRSVRAAVFLASQALPLFPCFAVGTELRTTGFYRDDEEDWFAWPVWGAPISLDTLRSLLSQPVDTHLRDRGIERTYRCRRTRTGGAEGNYQTFSFSEECPLGATQNDKL